MRKKFSPFSLDMGIILSNSSDFAWCQGQTAWTLCDVKDSWGPGQDNHDLLDTLVWCQAKPDELAH